MPAYLPTKFTGDLADAVDTAAATAEPGERAARLMAIANAALDLRAELDPPSEALVEAAILWHRLPAAAAALADLPAGPARTRAAGLLGSALLAAGDRDVAVALAASLGGDPAADVILVLVGLSQTAAGSPKAALRFAVGLSDQSRRSLVLEAIADAELGAGDLPGARAAASLIADETARTAIFEAVVTQALRGDRVDEARAAVLALPPAAQAAALQAIVDALVAPPADPAASGPSASAEDAPRTPAAVAPVVETGVFDILPATRMPIIDGGIIRSPISCQRSGPSAIGVVVTDLGLSSSRTRLAIDTLPQAVAFAFDPYALDPVAIDDAREGGHAILAMAASVGEGFDDPGPFALDPEATVAENGDRLAWTLERVPEAIGVVLSDSAASASSGGVAAALRSAAGSPMLVAVGDIEVGLPDETGSYTTLFAEAGEQARRRGRAIVTVAPYPAALAYLSEWLGRLPADGLALVPVTQFARGARPGEAAADPAGCPTFPP